MEPRKNKENNGKLLARRLSLPLFMLSRNRIKYSQFNDVKKYINKSTRLYQKPLDEDLQISTSQHIKQSADSAEQCRLTKHKDSNFETKHGQKLSSKSWQLPPNLYDTIKIPYESKKGAGGAYWPKKNTNQSKHVAKLEKQPMSHYIAPKVTDKIFAHCSRTKGVFLTNARERRPTTRCMVSNTTACCKNPSDPGPATYNPTEKKNSFSASLKIPQPHIFYRSSTVPVKKNSIHTSHISFAAAPGRYEVRYPNTCPCPARFTYQPQLDILVDKEKRNKFRRLPFEKLKAEYYTSADWRHVKGRGFHYLFKGFKALSHQQVAQQETGQPKTIKLFPDSKYLSMINNPLRTALSLRPSPVSTPQPRIVFNCTTKKLARKHLKSNKKIAFNSSQERYPDGYRIPILTQHQQTKLKHSLPLERQIRDHPILNKRPSEINSKLNQTPKHMLPNYVLRLRKKIFKFQPLPQYKVLATETDTNVEHVTKEGFYLTVSEAKNFFKESDKF